MRYTMVFGVDNGRDYAVVVDVLGGVDFEVVSIYDVDSPHKEVKGIMHHLLYDDLCRRVTAILEEM